MENESDKLERIVASDEAPLVRPVYPTVPYNSYGYGYGEEQEGIHLRDIWRVVQKRKWLILSIAVVVTIIVTIEAYRTKPTYTASAIVELGKENTTMVKSGTGDVVIQTDDSDPYNPEISIKTKMIRLTSEPLLESVVVGLRLDQNPKFIDGGKNSVWEALQAMRNRFGKQQSEPPSSGIIEPVNSGSDGGLIRSPDEIERLAPFVSILSRNLEVEQIKDSRVLKITFSHTEPAIAASVANGIAQNFIESNFQNKTQKFTSASQWLDTTTRELKARVERAEQDLANYSRAHNIFSTDGKETLTTDKLARLHDQTTRAETDRILRQSLYEEVKAGRVSELPAAFSDPKISSLQSKLEELQANADKLGIKYGPDNPVVIEIKQQIATTRSQLEDARRALEDKLKGEYSVASRDEQSLKVALAQAKNEAVQQNQDAIQYNILKQEVDTAKSLYTEFLQKTHQAKAEVAQQHNNLQLIQPARIPKTPAGPGRLRTILFGFLLSVAAGVGLAFFLEYLDSSIRTVEDVGRYVQLPALGVIPAISGKGLKRVRGNGRKQKLAAGNGAEGAIQKVSSAGDRKIIINERSSAAEAYRVLRTSMLLSTPGKPPKTILITSGQPGEGKTTTAVNTAISFAQLGASVLIIDCDLRRPVTHRLFGIDPEVGLSTYLCDESDIDGYIQRLQIPNLSLMPCGHIPPNPAELLSSERMKSMLAILSQRYDHILVDSPPLIGVADALILSTLVDGVILVVHGGKSTRALARRARQELVNVGAKIFGVVLNNLDLKDAGYDNYNYYQNHLRERDESNN
jgi:polysaccharide biosynthesis transport protein